MSMQDIDPIAPFALLPRDQHSELWMRLRPYLEARLESLRRSNDADLTPEKTAMLRGRIAEVKWLLGAEGQQE